MTDEEKRSIDAIELALGISCGFAGGVLAAIICGQLEPGPMGSVVLVWSLGILGTLLGVAIGRNVKP